MTKRLPRLANCPVELALGALRGKWKPVILAHLKDSPLRYGQLRRRMPHISDKVLSERLHDLTGQGLVVRSGDPTHAVYALTPRADGLRPALAALYAWGTEIAPLLGVTFASLPPDADPPSASSRGN